MNILLIPLSVIFCLSLIGAIVLFKFLKDAGVIAINSRITVKDCVIMPDPAIFGEAKYGKGI